MPITLDTGGGASGPPSIKLRNVNDWCDVAVVNVEQVPAYVFGTREQAVTVSGKPKTQDKVTVLVVNPGTAVVTEGEADRALVVGETATVYIEGQTRWDPDLDKQRGKGDMKSWSGAKEDHGPLLVGDVFRWQFTGELQGKGAQPRRLRLFKLRSPKPGEEAQTARCEALYAEAQQGTRIPVGGHAAPVDDPF